MHCQLRTQQELAFDGEAQMVVARSPNGAFAVMDGHAPLFARLEAAPLRIKTADKKEHTFAVTAGILRVSENEVTILAQKVIPAEKIELASIQDRMEKIKQEIQSANEEDRERLEKEMTELRAQTRAKNGNV
jgi:F-type H+-transporting ATPase subunit epsilon